jgi:hypothetical protein
VLIKSKKITYLRVFLILSVLLFLFLNVGCRPKSNKELYKEKVKAIIKEVYRKTSDFTKEHGELEKGLQRIDVSTESEKQKLKYYRYGVKKSEYGLKVSLMAKKQFQKLVPPPEYKRGHQFLIRIYELYIQLLKIEIRKFEFKQVGKDTSGLDKKEEGIGDKIIPAAEKADKFLNSLKIGLAV